jgi:hypothetical protein
MAGGTAIWVLREGGQRKRADNPEARQEVTLLGVVARRSLNDGGRQHTICTGPRIKPLPIVRRIEAYQHPVVNRPHDAGSTAHFSASLASDPAE